MTTITTGRGLPDWTNGTASVANDSTSVAFSGANLISTDSSTGALLYVAGRGDRFEVPGVGEVMIDSVVDAEHVTLAQPWPFASQNAAAYAIVRMSFPATGTLAKAVQDLQNMGTDANPETSWTIDDGTARLKLKIVSGVPVIATGPSGAADAALIPHAFETRASVNDITYIVKNTDRMVAYTAISAARAVMLPASAAYPSGAVLLVVDESGHCSATNKITLTPSGSEKINGASTAVIQSAYGHMAIESNGAGAWTIVG